MRCPRYCLATGRRIGSAALLFLAAALPCGRAAAQFFSPRQILDSPLHDRGSPLGLRPRLLTAGDAADRSERPHITYGITVDESVRTAENGAPVGDLYGSGRSLAASFTGKRGLQTQLYWERAAQHALLVERGDTRRTTADMTGEQQALRLTLPQRWGESYVGYTTASARTNGASDFLTRILPLFDATPTAAWAWTRRELVLGAVAPVGRRFHIEAAGSWNDSPGSFTLAEPDARLTAPLGGSGSGWSLALRGHAAPMTQLFAFAQRTGTSGRATAWRDGTLPLGTGEASHGQDGWGMALRRTVGKGQAAMLSYAVSHARLDAHAFGLNPLPLGFSPSDMDRAGYYLRGNLTRREIGVQWERGGGTGRSVQLDYRWLETPVRVAYGYTASLFLVGVTDGGEWNVPDARGHLLRGRYALPVRGVKVTLDASQVIPMPLRRAPRDPNTPPPPPGPQRRVSGGWNVQMTVSHPL